MEPSGTKRILLIDIARLYAMALVYYGHFIERIMLLNNPAAAAQYKFIYSFHMLLFFILAGYVVRERDLSLGFGRYIKYHALSRLLPFVFFTAFFMVLPVFFSGDFFHLQLPSVKGYLTGLLNTVFGIPMFCVPSWFILMLFSVEMVHYAAFRFLQTNAKILVGAVVFYVAGYWVNMELDIFNPVKGRTIGWNYLFIHEAVTMYAFYLIGVYLRRNKVFMEKMSPRIAVPGLIISFLIVLLTYNLNTGLFNFTPYDAVVIIFASHGHFLWFPVTAVAGSFCILFLARLTPPQKTIVWMGQNTLILMCLNGIFYHFINLRVAQWVVGNLTSSAPVVFGVGCVMTVASLALCIPLIFLFNRYIPQLVGKPKRNGPWFKSFI
ncbi:MAG: acyltransferase family protein [Thermodesulfobacteriota bacterium]|nr:acyltransferase family protein [Thermodesulfobacteriota bacterium]